MKSEYTITAIVVFFVKSAIIYSLIAWVCLDWRFWQWHIIARGVFVLVAVYMALLISKKTIELYEKRNKE
jgi:hypothetical protein